MTPDKTYKGWPLLEEIPEGWSLFKNLGSPLHGYVYVTNGKSVFSGERRVALLRVASKPIAESKTIIEQPQGASVSKNKDAYWTFKKEDARVVNELARQQTKQKLLQDILFDLTVCEIEGWSKSEYLDELRQLINGIGKEHHIAQNPCRECEAKQAQINRLMLEYCPDEMTSEQLEEWANSQVAYMECRP